MSGAWTSQGPLEKVNQQVEGMGGGGGRGQRENKGLALTLRNWLSLLWGLVSNIFRVD
jgi:hypothetical protein